MQLFDFTIRQMLWVDVALVVKSELDLGNKVVVDTDLDCGIGMCG